MRSFIYIKSIFRSVGKWYLGMNLNPADGHIMEYTTGWVDGLGIGSPERAFIADYINKEVWNMPVNRIAIVRHNMVWTPLFTLFFSSKNCLLRTYERFFN